MRTAVLAATLAFQTALAPSGGVLPATTRRVGRLVMAWLDRRRTRMNAEDGPTDDEVWRPTT